MMRYTTKVYSTKKYVMSKYILILAMLLLLQFNNVTYMESNEETGADLLMKYGFITGIDGDAMLDKIITRAQVAVLMAELHGDKETAANFPLPSEFSDVPDGMWYTPYITYGKIYGYLGGYPDGTFKPNEPVDAQEFAAFMMNAMGYNGDYHYDQVIQFAKSKNVSVVKKLYIFLRRDAFEAMWDVVNQPAKGSNITIGMALGKLDRAYTDNNAVENPVEATGQADIETKVEASGRYSVDVQFDEIITDYERVSLVLREYMFTTPVELVTKTAWNGSKTVATITTYVPLEIANFDVVVNDARGDHPVVLGIYKFSVEKEKIGKIEIESNLITMIDDYTGTIAYKAYNQYGDDVTNTPLGETLFFNVTTNVPKPEVDFSKGIITIRHGSATGGTASLKALSKMGLLIAQPTSGFIYNTVLVVPE